jgi:hypothetical protein
METFLIRVWLPSDGTGGSSGQALHGLAEHVRSGSATAFMDGDQLCAWLHATAAEQGGVAARGGGSARGGP